jgi:membrane fusion protein (multidrug efflux system)
VRPVEAGHWIGKDWVILGGLRLGDRVIVDNLIKLRPGMAVSPQPHADPSAAPPPSAQISGDRG